MTTIPTKEDISPYGTLDELTAVKNFYGKNQSEAAKLFFENPMYYQEDLMWMGDKAFIFYFPCVEPYLLSEESADDSCTISALIAVIKFRLEFEAQSISGCLGHVLRILSYMSDNIAKFDVDIAIDGDIAGKLHDLIGEIQGYEQEGWPEGKNPDSKWRPFLLKIASKLEKWAQSI